MVAGWPPRAVGGVPRHRRPTGDYVGVVGLNGSGAYPPDTPARGSVFEDTVVREVKEETGLDVTVGQLVNMTSGYKLRLEVAYAAELVGGVLKRFLRDPRVAVVRVRRASLRCPGRSSTHDRKECGLVCPPDGSTEGPHHDRLGLERAAQR